MYLENKIRKRNKGIKYCLQTAAMVESSTRQYLKKTAVPLINRTWAATRCGNPESHAPSKQAATQRQPRAFPANFLTLGGEAEIQRHSHSTRKGAHDHLNSCNQISLVGDQKVSDNSSPIVRQAVSQSEAQIKAYLHYFLPSYWQNV